APAGSALERRTPRRRGGDRTVRTLAPASPRAPMAAPATAGAWCAADPWVEAPSDASACPGPWPQDRGPWIKVHGSRRVGWGAWGGVRGSQTSLLRVRGLGGVRATSGGIAAWGATIAAPAPDRCC